MAHPVDLLVDRGFLLDERIGARHIGFRLVVIVVGDEIFHRIVGEEGLHLAIELGGQRLVGREDDGGALGFLNDLRGGEGLARTGDAEQHLRAVIILEAFDTRSAIAVGWSPDGLKSVTISEAGYCPRTFPVATGRCGVHILPSLNSGLPDWMRSDKA